MAREWNAGAVGLHFCIRRLQSRVSNYPARFGDMDMI